MHVSAEPEAATTVKSHPMERARMIAAQFEYSDDDIRRCVQKFLMQMGVYTLFKPHAETSRKH